MWPWGHLAVGYLVYSLVSWYKTQKPPSALGTVALGIGTQFPDLLGKPLAWTFGVLPTGRSLFHSLLTCTVIVGGLWYWRKQRRRAARPVGAFAIGYVSHLFGDALYFLLKGDFANSSFLLWPVIPLPPSKTGGSSSGTGTASGATPAPSSEVQHSIIGQFTHMEVTWFFTLQLVLGLVAVFVWMADGMPGSQRCWSLIKGKSAQK